jgi:hypothetical protein
VREGWNTIDRCARRTMCDVEKVVGNVSNNVENMLIMLRTMLKIVSTMFKGGCVNQTTKIL